MPPCEVGNYVDESLFVKMKHHKGKDLKIPQVWVFGLYERQTKKCIFVVVPSRDAFTLLNVIYQYVKPRTVIHSDCWRSNIRIRSLDKHFEHKTVNHNLWFKDPKTGVHTNGIESVWNSALKLDGDDEEQLNLTMADDDERADLPPLADYPEASDIEASANEIEANASSIEANDLDELNPSFIATPTMRNKTRVQVALQVITNGPLAHHDNVSVVVAPVAPKRGRGRPVGSKSKKQTIKLTIILIAVLESTKD